MSNHDIPFFGREKELGALRELQKKKTASLVVIKGRRRIGKSRLASEFGKFFEKCLIFTGLPPTRGVGAKKQRKEFIRKLEELRIPRLPGNDWGDLFRDLAYGCKNGRTLIVLDEISWMGARDATFLGQLKTAWDEHFTRNPQLIMILSGSQSTWIEDNILKSTGFVGRISYRLTLRELPLSVCNLFWQKQAHVSSYEKFKLLAVTGGIPRYLEEIQPHKSAEENIKLMCFESGGLLFNEFEQIFSDLFMRRSSTYKKIVRILAHKEATLEEISLALERTKGGDLSKYLDDLCETGFVTRDFSWHIKESLESKLSRFRLSDNYLRFYLRYIEPNRRRIEGGLFTGLPSGWLSILGLQFENLILNNRQTLRELLKIPPEEIVYDNSYFQTQTTSRRGCQVDYLVQTKYGTLYICEVKFKQGLIDLSVIEEVQEKISSLDRPKWISCRPVLIHVNGVMDSVKESDFFAHIIDFGQLL